VGRFISIVWMIGAALKLPFRTVAKKIDSVVVPVAE